MLRLSTFGTPVVTRDGVVVDSLSAQRRALALVAMVATAGTAGVSRDVIAARLWPESDEARALLSLRQLLHLTHSLLGEPELLGSGPELRLNAARCSSDIGEFLNAVASGDHARVAALYTAPFLDGFNLRRAPGVEEWIAKQRSVFSHQVQSALEKLAIAATDSGAHRDAVEHWRRLVEIDPLSGRLATGYMQALAAAGDRATALQHARLHAALMAAELNSEPDHAVEALAEQLRSEPRGAADVLGAPGSARVQDQPAAVNRETDVSAASTSSPTPVRDSVGANQPANIATRRMPLALASVTAVLLLLLSLVYWPRSDDREISAGDTAATASSSGTNVPPPTLASVAVLPFANGSEGQADMHASEGMTDELIGALGRVAGLRVIARTSVFALRGKSLDVRSIADTLGVGAVVEGSWRRSGSRLRVTAQLVRAEDQAVLWSGRYDRQIADVLDVQEDIARSIVVALLPQLNAQHARTLRPYQPGTSDPVAYELYLRGRQAFYSRTTPDGLAQARSYFLQALSRDSMFARAHAGRSDAATRMAVFGHAPPAKAFAEARTAADRAIAIDSTLAEAHASRGHALFVAEFAWEEGERSFERALALDPNAVSARAPYAIGLASQGRFDEALTQLAIARSIDPLSPSVNNVLGRVLLSAGRVDSALRTLTTIITLDPRQDLAWQQLGHAHMLRGEHQQAITAFEHAAALSGARDSAHLAFALASSGRRDEARRILRMLGEDSNRHDALSVHFAIARAGLGDADRAFQWLERGYALRASFMVGIASEPALRSLHGDPRWNALLRRMGLPRETRGSTR